MIPDNEYDIRKFALFARFTILDRNYRNFVYQLYDIALVSLNQAISCLIRQYYSGYTVPCNIEYQLLPHSLSLCFYCLLDGCSQI